MDFTLNNERQLTIVNFKLTSNKCSTTYSLVDVDSVLIYLSSIGTANPSVFNVNDDTSRAICLVVYVQTNKVTYAMLSNAS